MAQSTVNITSSWASIKSGAATVNIFNTGSQPLYIRVATSTPNNTTDVGAILDIKSGYPFKAAAGENIYAKVINGTAGAVEVVDA